MRYLQAFRALTKERRSDDPMRKVGFRPSGTDKLNLKPAIGVLSLVWCLAEDFSANTAKNHARFCDALNTSRNATNAP